MQRLQQMGDVTAAACRMFISQGSAVAGGLNAEWLECRTVISTISGGMPNGPNGRNAEWRCWLICTNESKYLEIVCWLCTCLA